MIDRAVRCLELALALALIGAVVLNFANVVGRYGFGLSFAADEVQTYAMVYIAFLGAALASWRGLHLRMDVLAQRFPPRLRRVLEIVELLLVVALCGLVTVVAWQYVAQMHALGAKSQTAQIPMWIPHSAVGAGFGLMVLFALAKFFRR